MSLSEVRRVCPEARELSKKRSTIGEASDTRYGLVGNRINQAAAAFLRSPTLASVVNTYIDTTQSNAELSSRTAFSMVRPYTRGWVVFPIRIPPLRERPEDIPLLVRSFTQRYGRRMSKDIQTIPASTMKRLIAWHDPSGSVGRTNPRQKSDSSRRHPRVR